MDGKGTIMLPQEDIFFSLDLMVHDSSTPIKAKPQPRQAKGRLYLVWKGGKGDK